MIALPSSEEASDLADWVEASCLFVDGSLSHSQIGLALGAEELDDTIVEDISYEVHRREQMAKSYPLTTRGTRFFVKRKWNQSVAYSFQLLLTFLREFGLSGDTRAWPRLSKQFERLSELAVRQYLHGLSLNIGTPRNAPIPRGFADCLHHISQTVREHPVRQEHLDYSGPVGKDEGVDVVAWIPFEDDTPSQVVLLVNCSAGKDWKEKRTELDMKYWSKIIDWHVRPSQGFSIPFVYQRDEAEWRGLSTHVGVLFDRMRISALFESSRQTQEKTLLVSELQKSCKTLIGKLPPWD
jgi:hypothetical protein